MPSVSKVEGRGWIQEWYETGDPDLKARAKSLRARGYRVHSESMGSQVTQWGRLKMTLLDIRPGTSGDNYLEQVNPRRRRAAGRRNAGKRKRAKRASWSKTMRALGASTRRPRSAAEELYRYGSSVKRGKYQKAPGYRENLPRVKGRKVKGGRAVTLHNFTGTIVKRTDGTVQFLGRGRKR